MVRGQSLHSDFVEGRRAELARHFCGLDPGERPGPGHADQRMQHRQPQDIHHHHRRAVCYSKSRATGALHDIVSKLYLDLLTFSLLCFLCCAKIINAVESAPTSSPLKQIIDPAADLKQFLESDFEPDSDLESSVLQFLFAEIAQDYLKSKRLTSMFLPCPFAISFCLI